MKVFGDLRFWLVIALLAFVPAYSYGGPNGATGLLLGLSGTGFSIFALWLMTGLLGKMAGQNQPPKAGTILILLSFFVKLPILVGFGLLSQRLGGAAPTCFLSGLALVYFAMVGWALAKS